MQKNNTKNFAAAILGFSILLSLISGCSKEGAYILVPQQWSDIEFVVEIRPGAPRHGMNEFVIVATDSKGVPGYNYIVSIKMQSSDRWMQMVQDGHSGVYRRAIAVNDPVNGVLMVEVRHRVEKDVHTEFQFPLSKHI